MKSEKAIRAIMKRFSVSRQEALTAPDAVIDLINDEPISLTKEELEFGKRVAQRLIKEGKI